MDFTCAACSGQWPSADHRIADFETSIAYLFDDQFFPGWTVLVLKRHATELFRLSADERSRLIEEVSMVGEALMETFHAVKVNYELLGNQLPHIHWHVIPRLTNDPAPRDPAWVVGHEKQPLTPTDLAERVALVRSRLFLKNPGHSSHT
ncbi:MAG TPA: HIT family protein [Nitrospiraceae bacterium]|nr:HIT family protein [Nitrospiraceae bacterium]